MCEAKCCRQNDRTDCRMTSCHLYNKSVRSCLQQSQQCFEDPPSFSVSLQNWFSSLPEHMNVHMAASVLTSWVLGRQNSLFDAGEVEPAKPNIRPIHSQSGPIHSSKYLYLYIHIYIHAYIKYFPTAPTFPYTTPHPPQPHLVVERGGGGWGTPGWGGGWWGGGVGYRGGIGGLLGWWE
jgi:hypothetical protein